MSDEHAIDLHYLMGDDPRCPTEPLGLTEREVRDLVEASGYDSAGRVLHRLRNRSLPQDVLFGRRVVLIPDDWATGPHACDSDGHGGYNGGLDMKVPGRSCEAPGVTGPLGGPI